MRKLKFTLDRRSLEIIYISFIRPLLEYGDVVFSNCTNEQILTLEKIQYEAARIVSGTTKLVSIQKLSDEIGWESLETRRLKHRLILFYKMKNGQTPSYLSDLCPPPVTRNYNLRTHENLRVPRARTSLYYDSFLPSTTRAFNELSPLIRNAPTISSFKKQLSEPLRKIPKYFYSGKRKSQVLHTRLRTNCSSLADDLFSKNIVQSPLCACGQRETSSHFLLHCPRYTNIRITMINSVRAYCNATLHTLLFGNSSISDEANECIFLAVQKFIELSKRFD